MICPFHFFVVVGWGVDVLSLAGFGGVGGVVFGHVAASAAAGGVVCGFYCGGFEVGVLEFGLGAGVEVSGAAAAGKGWFLVFGCHFGCCFLGCMCVDVSCDLCSLQSWNVGELGIRRREMFTRK